MSQTDAVYPASVWRDCTKRPRSHSEHQLEDVLQTKLEDAPRNRTRRDLPEESRIAIVDGKIELRVIEKVEEFRPELKDKC